MAEQKLDPTDGLDCCRGESSGHHPRGFHSPQCPVYLANCDALERMQVRPTQDVVTQPPSGADLIAAERSRQVTAEDWSPEHDMQHLDDALALAAVSYALPAHQRSITYAGAPFQWPWDLHWWKPTPDDRVRELVKAGALIAAEIDRIQRRAITSNGQGNAT